MDGIVAGDNPVMRSSKICQRILFDERYREEERRRELPDEDVHGGKILSEGGGNGGGDRDEPRRARMRGSCATPG